MASPEKVLVLDLGMQALRLAEFSTLPGGELKLLRGARRELLIDPAMDATRPDQIKLAIQEILQEWSLRRGNVVCILPSHSVFTRVVPLDVPGGTPEQIEAVVHFEAQQNIPFPLEEVVWDYVVIGATPSGAVNTVFVAVKTDLLEPLCAAIGSTGLRIRSLSVAPLALYDAFRCSYPDMADATTVLLDIGSRTTNMVIAAPESFFSRSIPSGGLAVTSSIAKEIHAQPEEAENLKISRGSVALGAGFEPPSDPVEANLARVARQTLLRTQTDISRSLSYYRSTMGGADPSRVMLSGGMAAMPYLAEFLAEKLQKETVFFEPLRGITHFEAEHSTSAAFIESNPHNLGELIGGALVLTDFPRTEVHLLPPSLSRKREFATRLPWLVGAAAIVLTILSCWCGYAVKATSVTRDETAALTITIDGEKRLAAEIQKTDAELTKVRETSSNLLSLVRFREAYPSLLTELSVRLPERFVWMTEIQAASEAPQSGAAAKTGDASTKALLIKGLYLDNPRQAGVIDDFVNSLQSSELFDVDEKEKSKIITQRGSPSGEYWAYPFALRIPLRSPIPTLP